MDLFRSRIPVQSCQIKTPVPSGPPWVPVLVPHEAGFVDGPRFALPVRQVTDALAFARAVEDGYVADTYTLTNLIGVSL